MTQERFNELANNYPEIIARMLWHQAHQGREMTYGPGIDNRSRGKGFSWVNTPEGIKFWKVIMNRGEIDNSVVSIYTRGDSIIMTFKGKPKEYIFFDWDLKHFAVLVMTRTAWNFLNDRPASESMHQDIRKMPISNIVW